MEIMTSLDLLVQTMIELGLYSLVWITGLILALVFWKKCPQVALLVLLACIIELAWAGTYLIEHWLLLEGAWDGGKGLLWTMTKVFRRALGAAGWGLMLWAAFGWRGLRQVAYADLRPLPLPPRRPLTPPGLAEEADPETIRERP